MTFWADILCCADGSYYAGHTDNFEHRIGQHQSGGIPDYTHARRPVGLPWTQNFGRWQEALAAERQIRGWSRAKKEALARSDWTALHEAAMPLAEKALRLRSGRTETEND